MPRTMFRLPDTMRSEIVTQYTTPLPDGTWKGSKMIAQDLGISGAAVLNVLRENNIPIRSGKEAHAHGKRCGPIKHAEQFDDPPLCACGCGAPVPWRKNVQKWMRFLPGHRYKFAPYKDEAWLREQYIVLNRSAPEIAIECGVNQTSIIRYLERFGIPRRDASTSKIGRFNGSKNPAWKGGVAKWSYAPEWKRIARFVRKRDNYTCQDCKTTFPKQSRYLHVHHIDGDKTNNDPQNLVTMCAKCHPRGKRKENFNHLKDPHWRTKWLISHKGEVFDVNADFYLTTVEAAQRIGVVPAHIVDMIKSGRVSGKRMGWYWYIDRVPFETFMLTYKRRAKVK